MASVNKVILLGNLGRDPETRYTADGGTAICNIAVATSRRYKNSQGELQEETEWHRVVIFNPQLADTAERYLRKGSKVYLEGQLQTRKWTDNNGMDRYTTEVVLQNFNSVLVMLDSKNSGGDGVPAGGNDVFSAAPAAGGTSSGWDNSPASAPSDLDDDIPF